MSITLILIALAGIQTVRPMPVAADSVRVRNDINVSADTGGNVFSAQGAVPVQGEARVDVNIQQKINGTELPPVRIQKVSTSSKVEASVHTQIISPDVRSSTTIRQKISVRDRENFHTTEEVLSAFLKFLSNFLNNIKK